MGGNTSTVTKQPYRPGARRWQAVFEYIEATPQLQDIVVSGGDSYSLQAADLWAIGSRLVDIPHIRRFRFASKGLAVWPSRLLDRRDGWFDALIAVARKARREGKGMALHTHFNHPNEISWITREACQRLYEEGVCVRNQSVLLRGVNDDVETMGTLLRMLMDNHVKPVSHLSKFFHSHSDHHHHHCSPHRSAVCRGR